MIKKVLHVCLPCRDRLILTQKCIESIHMNFSRFDRINIYVFDNLSDSIPERFNLFSKLLSQNKIHYYSYDTIHSIYKCFPKAVIFNKFIDMMSVSSEVNKDPMIKNYYMLSDNDMLYGPNVDDYFISGLHFIENSYPHIRFLVKAPGGIPKVARQQGLTININSMYNNRKFKTIISATGGGGGFWFMNFKMLSSLKWNLNELIQTKNKFKMHDVITWKKIKKEQGSTAHVAGICPINPDKNPLVLHLGSKLGSICNSLTSNNYNQIKQQSKLKEEELKNISVSDLFEKYIHLGEW